MSNKIISNEMSSALDLSAIKDVHGNPVTLRPKAMGGSTREISADAANHEVVQRVLSLNWISIKPMGVMEPLAPASAPAPVAVVAAPAPVVAPPAKEEAEPVKAEEPKTEDSQAKRKR